MKLSDIAGRVRRPDVAPLGPGDPRRLGAYEIRGRIGRGGMGTVYLGETGAGRRLAIKVIRPEQADDGVNRRRFRREVRAAAGIRSPRTAAVVDWDVDAATPWLASEYIPGPTLVGVVKEHGSLPVAAVRELVSGLTEALTAVHDAGLVHRDVKPSNILLDGDGPRLIDLGIVSDPADRTITHSQETVGTPQYMSPEQALGKPVTPASDVWSLGAVAYAAATATAVFGSGPAPEVTHRVVYEEPSLAALPVDLRPLVAACLAKDPAARPALSEVAALLETRRVVPAAGWGGGPRPVPDRAPREPAGDAGEAMAGGIGRRSRWGAVVGLAAAGLVIAGGTAAILASRDVGAAPPPVAGALAGADTGPVRGVLPGVPPTSPPASPVPSVSPSSSAVPSLTPAGGDAPASTPSSVPDDREPVTTPARFVPGTVTLPRGVEVGQEITAVARGWRPVPDEVTCAWSVGGMRRDTLGSCTYMVGIDDVGSSVRARLTAVRAGYEERSATSNFTAVVPRPRLDPPECEIGLREVEASSRWGDAWCAVVPAPGVTYEWRWTDLTTGEVVGETEVQTQERVWVRARHAGHAVRCTVTATREGYVSGEWVAETRIPQQGGLERREG